MNNYRIVGFSRPNKVRIKSSRQINVIELPIRKARKLFEEGIINIENPDMLFIKI